MGQPSSVWAPEVMKALFQEIRKETATGIFSNHTISGVYEEEDHDGVQATAIYLKMPAQRGGSQGRRIFTHSHIRHMLDGNDYLKAKQVFYEFMRGQKDD